MKEAIVTQKATDRKMETALNQNYTVACNSHIYTIFSKSGARQPALRKTKPSCVLSVLDK